ncbi:MAG: 3-carboxy-cis,cis-muconate cycloisomerase [Devosia sp.]|nr:3-carboxy-cis,cis-muconate cycloisomerase [Devosia sp.]
MRRPLLSAIAGDEEIEAILSDEAQIGAMLEFERALARAEAAVGLISADAASAIASAIDRFRPDWDGLAIGMARDGVVVPELIAQLRSTVPRPFDTAVHHGATSQDVIDTALILCLSKIVPIMIDRIDRLESILSGLRDSQGSLPLMAHTRMQVALPVLVAEKLRTWSEPLARHRLALHALTDDLLVIQLGGPVGDRAGFAGHGAAVADALAAGLGLSNASAWHSSRERLVAFGGRLALLAGSLGKIGADICLLAQTEVGAIVIKGAGTSSAMAHKANPIRAEALIALARHAAGLAGSLGQAMVHENERSGSAWTLEWLTLPPLIIATGAATRLSESLLRSINFRSPDEAQPLDPV